MPTRSSLTASEANALGKRGEVVEPERGLGRRPLQPSPRAAPNVHGDEAGGGSRKDVVVDPVADVGDLARLAAHELDDRSKNAGSGLRTPRLADDEMTSAGSADVTRPRLERLGLVSDDADAEARAPEPARGSRARRDRDRRASTVTSCHQRGGLSMPRCPQSASCSSPRSIVTPSAAQTTCGCSPPRSASRRHQRSSSTSVSPTSKTTAF